MVVDPEAHTLLKAGRIGEVWVAGPSVALGYWRDRKATGRTFEANVVSYSAVINACRMGGGIIIVFSTRS